MATWTWWSTRDSINNDVPSVTAIMETLIAVAAYWSIAVYFETYLPLLVSVAVAPLVLLRSNPSIADGLKWFEAYAEPSTAAQNASSKVAHTVKALSACVICGLGTFFVAINFSWSDLSLPSRVILRVLAGFCSGVISGLVIIAINLLRFRTFYIWKDHPLAKFKYTAYTFAYLGGIVVGALTGIIAASIVRSNDFADLLFWGPEVGLSGFCFGLGLAVGPILVTAAVIRVLATVLHLPSGLRAMPDNFRRLVVCTSPVQEPELIPELPQSSDYSWTRKEEVFKSDYAPRFFTYPVAILVLVSFFGPSWLYRVTLKSTAWFWWPLAFLGSDLKRASDPDRFRQKVLETLWAKTSIALAVFTVAAFLTANFVLNGAAFRENPLLTPLGYFLIVDWSLGSWQVLAILMAAFSIAIVFLVDNVSYDFKHANEKKDDVLLADAKRKLGWIERVARFRFLMMLAFWLIVGTHALLYFNSLKCWFDLPPSAERWAQWLYGERMPQAKCAHFVRGRE